MFTVLRIAQGVCMASAFTLTLAYLGEECSAADAGGARRSPRPGLEFLLLRDAQSRGRRARLLYGRSCGCDGANRRSRILSLRGVARAPAQFRSCAPRSAGTFTYVNFVLVRPPLSLGPMELGFVYFVFRPRVVTTL